MNSQGGTRQPSRRRRPLRPAKETRAVSISEESQARLKALQTSLGELQESLLMASAQTEMGQLETTLRLLPTKIEELRRRGYAFRSFLEQKVSVLTSQWRDVSPQVSREVTRLTRELQQEGSQAERLVQQAMGGGTTAIPRAEAAVATLDRRVAGAHSAIGAMYGTLQQNVNQTRDQVEQIRWLLDELEQACFPLHPAEDPVLAAQAQLMETKKDGPKGVLYLTDERLMFEQKETRATKKVLFITTEKETVHELILEVPIGQIERVETSQKGFLGHKEMMNLIFTPEADVDKAIVRLHGADNEEWASLIGRVRSGEITKERSREKDTETLEELRDVPTTCPTCGAAIVGGIVRGVREITCQYCGTVIRV